MVAFSGSAAMGGLCLFVGGLTALVYRTISLDPLPMIP